MILLLKIVFGIAAITLGVFSWGKFTSYALNIISIVLIISGAIAIASTQQNTAKSTIICPNCGFRFNFSLYVIIRKREKRIACPHCGTVIEI